MNDLISRQAVKEWLDRWEGYIDKDIIARMQYRLVDIPSAQLKITECPMCPDCPDNCPLDIQMEEEKAQLFKEDATKGKTSDTIYRQAAIDALEREKTYCTAFREGYTPINVFEKYNAGLTDGIKALKKLPSAQPEPQWIPRSEPPKTDGVYIVYAPDYRGGSSSAKECYDGVMFSKYKNGKWSIEHGYYNRPNCVQAWRELPEPWRGEEHEHTMEEFMYGQDMGNPEDGSL